VLTFDEAAHRYYWNGQYVPNVSTIIERERLVNWGGASPQQMERARAVGSAVHKAVELDVRNDLDESTVHELVRPRLQAWRRFRDESGIRVESSEQRVYNARCGYAGTLDLLGELPRIGGVLLDEKTGTKQRATGYQTAAYLHALPKSEHKRKRFALHLRADGTYELVPYDDRNDFAIFCAALTLWNARNQL
jgi:hypothetical protein